MKVEKPKHHYPYPWSGASVDYAPDFWAKLTGFTHKQALESIAKRTASIEEILKGDRLK